MKKILAAFGAAALAVVLSIPAHAETTIGGAVVWDMGYRADSEELTENGKSDVIGGFMTVSDDSNITVTFKSEDQKIGVFLEIDLDTTVTRGPAFAWYTMGDFALVAGHNDTWAGDGVIGTESWLIDPTDGGMGITGHETRPMIALEWRSENFGVQVGLFEPILELDGVDDFRWVLPTLNLTLDAKFGNIQIAPNFGISHYIWESDSGDDSLVAWYVGLPAKISFGAFSVNLAVMYSVNGSADFATNELSAPVLTAAGEIEDSTTYGGWGELVFSSGDIEVGGGAAWMTVENDTWVASDVNQYKYYVYLRYTLHENMVIQPELGFIDYDKDIDDNEAGNSFQVGVRFEFTF